MEAVLALIAVLLVAASMRLWFGAAVRWRTGAPLLPAQPQTPVPWALIDLVLTFFLLVLFHTVFFSLIDRGDHAGGRLPLHEMSPRVRAAMLLASSLAMLSTVLVSAFLIRMRTAASFADFGLAMRGRFGRVGNSSVGTSKHDIDSRAEEPGVFPGTTANNSVTQDILLGAAAFAMLAPPVYAIQLVLVQWFPSEHPLVRILKENPDPTFMVLCGFSAVVVAPVAEEYLFRVLLQGWFQKLATQSADFSAIFFGAGHRRRTDDAVDSESSPLATADNDAENRQNPYRAPETGPTGSTVDALTDQPASTTRPRFWPVLASSGLFAALHAEHGPDPIPLFLLALGLGYIFQRTHRILPCIVVHLLLNALSMAALVLAITNSE